VTTRTEDGKPLMMYGTHLDISELKRIEEELAQSERIKGDLFEALEDSFVGYDAIDGSGHFVYVNPAYLQMWGYDHPDEVIGNDPATHCEDPDMPQHIMQTLREHGGGDFEFKARRKDGSTFDCHMKVVMHSRADGTEVFHGFSEDISERKQAEQSLERTTTALSEAQKIAHLGSFEYIAATRSTVWSEEEYRIYGLDPASPSPQYDVMLENCIHPDDAALLDEIFAKAMRDGTVYELEHRIVRPDGEVRWVHDRAHPYFNKQGELERYLGVTLDITERKLTEEQLRLSEAHLQAVVDGTTDAVYLKDTEGRYLLVNKAAAQFTGMSPEAILGHDDTVQFSADEAAAVMEQDRRILESGRVQTVEDRVTTADGVLRTFLSTKGPIRAEDGEVIGLFGVSRDVTELQLEQRQYTDELASMKEQAEAANRAKSVFLSNMSHEIRTPLNVILGFTQLLLKRELDTDIQSRLGKIEAAGKHLLSVLNDILDFSKIESGKVTLQPEDLSVPLLLEEVMALIANEANSKGLTVRTRAEPPLGWKRGDGMRLRQALLNYFGNAVKFTQSGEILINAREEEQQGERTLVRFEVTDTGPGIAGEDLPTLFHSFEQGPGTTGQLNHGSGLGLSITKLLAHMMGGSVGVESSPGRGSTFWFTAWLDAAARNHSTPPSETEEQLLATLKERHPGAGVLLVEDEYVNREVAADMLRHAGLRVEVAADGNEAVEKVRANRYDLVLMDVHMPVMSGLEATREIRKLPGKQDLSILAMTAAAFEDDKTACLDAGMNGVVTKPVETRELYAALVQWLAVGDTS
jgi:two-component system sensor histidine kinase/response regulator